MSNLNALHLLKSLYMKSKETLLRPVTYGLTLSKFIKRLKFNPIPFQQVLIQLKYLINSLANLIKALGLFCYAAVAFSQEYSDLIQQLILVNG